jgi:hypothetical protein
METKSGALALTVNRCARRPSLREPFHAIAIAGSIARGFGACLGRRRLACARGLLSSGYAVVSPDDAWRLHVSGSVSLERPGGGP